MKNFFSSYNNSKRLLNILSVIHLFFMMAIFAYMWETGYKITLVSAFPYMGDMAIVAVYCFLLIYLFRIYRCMRIGKIKISELIIGQTFSYFIAAFVFYWIYFFYYRNFFSPIPLMEIMLIQVAISVVWCILVNRLYYKIIKPAVSVVFYSDQSQVERLYENQHFSLHYKIIKAYDISTYDLSKMDEDLKGVHVVFCCSNADGFRDICFNRCIMKGIRCYYMPDISDLVFDNSGFDAYFNIPIMSVDIGSRKSIYITVKRILDIVLSFIAIILLSPAFIIASLVILLFDGAPVIYKQKRLTYDGRPFYIYKFRSMKNDAEKDGVARLSYDNDDRITRTGRIIRKLRIDEMPQLWNILKGDMSFVGPRPERPEIAEEYTKIYPDFPLRLRAKAGLTGLAQVYGKYNTEPLEKLKMDIIYINHMSMKTDFLLILLTLKTIFKSDSTEPITSDRLNALIRGDRA